MSIILVINEREDNTTSFKVKNKNIAKKRNIISQKAKEKLKKQTNDYVQENKNINQNRIIIEDEDDINEDLNFEKTLQIVISSSPVK